MGVLAASFDKDRGAEDHCCQDDHNQETVGDPFNLLDQAILPLEFEVNLGVPISDRLQGSIDPIRQVGRLLRRGDQADQLVIQAVASFELPLEVLQTKWPGHLHH